MILARYKHENIDRLTKIEEILSRKHYLEDYEGRLFCTGDNCDARLGFVEGQLSGRRNSFRTIRGDLHAQGCENEIDRSQVKPPKRGGNIVMSSIKKEHARSVLKRARDNVKGIRSKTRYDIKRKSKSQQIDNDLNVDNSPTVVSTVDSSIKPVHSDGGRSAPIRDKLCSDILPEDIGYTICLHGKLKDIVISETFINILYESDLEKPIYMELFTPFIINNRQVFELMKNFDRIPDAYPDGVSMIFGLGLLVEKENAYVLEMHNATHFYFDDDPIYVIIKKIKNVATSE